VAAVVLADAAHIQHTAQIHPASELLPSASVCQTLKFRRHRRGPPLEQAGIFLYRQPVIPVELFQKFPHGHRSFLCRDLIISDFYSPVHGVDFFHRGFAVL
jgi:hypothetical protein